MIRSIKDMIGYPLVAKDGKAGKVVDILFGDQHWRMRFLDVETKTGIRTHLRRMLENEENDEDVTRVLIEPSLLETPEAGLDLRHFPISGKRDRIKGCPSFETTRSVEEQYEEEFRRYSRKTAYEEFTVGFPPSEDLIRSSLISQPKHSAEEIQNHLERLKTISGEHVHSAKLLLGYEIRNEEEKLGYLSDLILDTVKWEIMSLVLDTRHGIPSKKFLVPISLLSALRWREVSIVLNVEKKDVDELGRYFSYAAVNEVNGRQYDYFGKPCLKELIGDYYL